MGAPTTSSPPVVVVDGTKKIKFQGGFWINKISYKIFCISKRLSTST